jgi:hypothetical protein
VALLAAEIVLARAHRAAFAPMLRARTPLPAPASGGPARRELHAAA